ncbi:MAG: N-6 DNA methylase [Rhodopirellula sp.]|nr:N-6 DNA methylase [Rhodopirellula sp.]
MQPLPASALPQFLQRLPALTGFSECYPHHVLAHESFSYGETQPLFRQLEEISQRSGVSRSAAFEDFLTASTCALAAETMEDEYLTMVERHKAGKPGKRSIDLIAKLFAQLINAMTRTDGDILGDLFQSAISHQESGQFFTPDSISQLMSQLSIDEPDEEANDRSPLLVSDPACGTGRMLIDAARRNPNVELFGQDVDARCVRICSINMGLRNLYGWVVCGNTLTCENRFAYRVAPFFHESPNGRRRGVIRDIPVEQTPALTRSLQTGTVTRDLFEDQNAAKPTAAETPASVQPAIMEIPRWITRLEQRLDVSDSTCQSSQDETAALDPEPDRGPKPDGPARQGNLF